MTKPKPKSKTKIQLGCALCGAPLSVQSGLLRCTDKQCAHLHRQGYVFQHHWAYEPVLRYQEYHRQTSKDVDKEMI
jgi:hypothetical protein